MQKLLRKNGEHVTKSLQLSHLEQRKTLQLRSLGAIIDIKKEIQNLTQVSMWSLSGHGGIDKGMSLPGHKGVC